MTRASINVLVKTLIAQKLQNLLKTTLLKTFLLAIRILFELVLQLNTRDWNTSLWEVRLEVTLKRRLIDNAH
ncbi:hypothetical protein BmR1_04g07895 [Babesia microti strain RI]|uniref:Uncharacterized protein n=1 Tax=Babesia microti (strain RI) TaxID=1133968 RepID=I7JDF3_BABMR|nr:hypothetical protein BmR1_04g07895 [Babesia microti strain RI]CCF75765.1 hypothetical protein BmR1_04g07895 [Babesia microti strain RI]|eukprot:XP_012650173.1 hypothetical protein BmR1_04g07895 [Babesia microti strain RI]